MTTNIKNLQHAVKLTRMQWTLMRDNPTWSKSTALEAMGHDPTHLFNRCFLCEFNYGQNDTCSPCPLVNCTNNSSIYQIWVKADEDGNIASKCVCAQSILDKLDEWEEAHPRYHESAIWADVKVERNPLIHPDKGDLFKWTAQGLVYYFVLMHCPDGYALVDIHSGSTKAGVKDTAEDAFGDMRNGLEYIGNAVNIVHIMGGTSCR